MSVRKLRLPGREGLQMGPEEALSFPEGGSRGGKPTPWLSKNPGQSSPEHAAPSAIHGGGSLAASGTCPGVSSWSQIPHHDQEKEKALTTLILWQPRGVGTGNSQISWTNLLLHSRSLPCFSSALHSFLPSALTNLHSPWGKTTETPEGI